MKWLGALGMCVAVGLVSACGSDDDEGSSPGPTGCGKTPTACPADQTCWPVSTSGHLECSVAPVDQTQGKDCTLLIGQATCAPGLYCFPNVSGTSNGTCQPFCQSGTCSGDSQCFQVGSVGGTEIVPVCSPPPVDVDAGTDSGTGGGAGAGSGGSAGSSSGGTAGTSSGGASGNAGDGG
jgi:hypothetical protein